MRCAKRDVGTCSGAAASARAARPAREAPPPSAAHRPQRLRMAYVIYVNGSNRDRAYLAAAACIWRVDDCGNAARLQWPWHHVVALPGYFVGPATSELVAVILGYRMHNEFVHTHRLANSQLFTDSETAFGYADNDPTSPEGQKLCPLIHLMRAEIKNHHEHILCLCSGKENPADSLAYSAMHEVGPSSGEPPDVWFDWCGFAPPPGSGMDDDLLDAIREVERRMLHVHPPSNTMNMLQA